jgi:hypothetical protein
MNIIWIIMLFLMVLALPVAWLISEVRAHSLRVRCTLGILAMLSCIGVAYVDTQLTRLKYNAWYGLSSRRLIDVIVEKLDEGQTEILKTELRSLQTDFHPTYESKAHYNERVDATVKNIKSEKAANQVPEDAARKLADPQH